ncbi:MAG: hypothetical protein K2K84_01890 [Muribaculaceae bacterium]|nr:hypothetical protein [Muribaculaceae bacterium]
MKKISFVIAFATLFALVSVAQAKKPKLMIIPSRTWMTQNNYMTDYTDMSGNTIKTPDYQAAFDNNADVSMIIGAMQDFMNKEGYEVVDLKGTLAKIQNRSARDNMTTAGGGLQQSPIDLLNKTAKADINVELQYAIKKDGPYKYIEFNISALDAYTSKPVSTGNIGRGTSGAGTDLVNQLEEAVLSFKDNFISDMDRYYNRLWENGRQVVIRCTLAENAMTNYEEEFDDEELATLIEEWVSDNAYKGNYTLSDRTENELLFDDVRIPMTYVDKNGNTKGTDASWFGSRLRKFIEAKTGEKCKLDLIGLGEINLILGGKS